MPSPDPRWQQLRSAFSAELAERARELNRLLLRLERGEDGAPERAETLAGLFREAHSLKGAARAVGLDRIERLAHGIETSLDQVRRGGGQPPPGWFDAVYRAVDALGELDAEAGPAESSSVDLPGILAGLGDAPAPSNGPTRRPTTANGSGSRRPTAEPAPPTAGPTGPSAGPPRPTAQSRRRPAAQDREETAAHAPARGDATTETVRVAIGKLDGLLAQAGELAVTHLRVKQRVDDVRVVQQDLRAWRRQWRQTLELRSNLRRRVEEPDLSDGLPSHDLAALLRFAERAEQRTRELAQRVEALADQLRDDVTELGLVARGIEEHVMAARLLPLATVMAPLERMVRDLTRATGKEARLIVVGGETEVDRRILEQLRDPLMHMLRNAIDHGIEPPDEREASGKPRLGTIRLAAAQRGGAIELELEDDGAGLDPARLRRAAVARGLLSDGAAAEMDDRAALDLIFRPGFSTSTTVTDLSGRGVGTDVVREHVRRLGGGVSVSSTPGVGTRFTLNVPLTLATTQVVLVEQGGQLFALPASAVERSQRIRGQQIVSLEGRRAVAIDGRAVPVVELSDVLERPRTPRPAAAGDWRPFFVLKQADWRVAFLTDRLVGAQEIVVRKLGWPLRRVRNVAGATVLGSGRAAVILEPSDLLRSAAKLIGAGGAASGAPEPAAVRPRRVLVVDDSLTTRSLEQSILEAHGYEVAVAGNGLEALARLRSEPLDLVVADLEMPRMDGYALTAEIRRDERLRHLPVVLVTSLDSPEHRERGVAVGADAYIVKSGFDQNELLETLGRLL